MNTLRTLAFVFCGLGVGNALANIIIPLIATGDAPVKFIVAPVFLFISCALFAAYIWRRDANERKRMEETMRQLRNTMPESW